MAAVLGMDADQIDAVFEDIDVDAVKIGMVSVPETIRVIASKLRQYQPRFVVIDPVMVATSGHRLLVPEAEQTLKEVLLPLADVLTPNIPEAEVLTGKTIENLSDMEEAAKAIGATNMPATSSPTASREDTAWKMRRIFCLTVRSSTISRGNA